MDALKDVNIKEILDSDEFRNSVQTLGSSLGVSQKDLQSTMTNPDFLNQFNNIANNIDTNEIFKMASSMLGANEEQLSAVKNTLASAQSQLSDYMTRSSDVRITLDITLGESYNGLNKKITVKRLAYDKAKQNLIQEKQKLIVRIHPGVTSGHEMVIDNEGDAYIKKGSDGVDTVDRSDLIITINVKNNTPFIVREKHLIYKQPVNLSDFLIDKTYTIKFVDSEDVVITKAAAFKPKDRMIGVVKGLGMPGFAEGDDEFGDLYVLFNIRWKGSGTLADTVEKVESYTAAAPASDESAGQLNVVENVSPGFDEISLFANTLPPSSTDIVATE